MFLFHEISYTKEEQNLFLKVQKWFDLCVSYTLSWPVQAAITKYHRPGGLNNRHFLSHISGKLGSTNEIYIMAIL